jgi:hypothetical protein
MPLSLVANSNVKRRSFLRGLRLVSMPFEFRRLLGSVVTQQSFQQLCHAMGSAKTGGGSNVSSYP